MDMFKEDIDSFRDEDLGNGLVDEEIARMLADNNGKIMPVIEILLERKRAEKFAKEQELFESARDSEPGLGSFGGVPFSSGMYGGFPQAMPGAGFPSAQQSFSGTSSGSGGVGVAPSTSQGSQSGMSGTSSSDSEPQLRFPRGTTPQQAEQWKNSYSQLTQMGYKDDGYMMDIIAQCNGSVAKAVEFLGSSGTEASG